MEGKILYYMECDHHFSYGIRMDKMEFHSELRKAHGFPLFYDVLCVFTGQHMLVHGILGLVHPNHNWTLPL